MAFSYSSGPFALFLLPYWYYLRKCKQILKTFSISVASGQPWQFLLRRYPFSVGSFSNHILDRYVSNSKFTAKQKLLQLLENETLRPQVQHIQYSYDSQFRLSKLQLIILSLFLMVLSF